MQQLIDFSINAKLDASKFCANVADDLRAELALSKAAYESAEDDHTKACAELADAKETISRYETTAENCDVLRAELAAIKAQEPVAWETPSGGIYRDKKVAEIGFRGESVCKVTPLYAAPVQQVSVPDCFERYRLADKFCEQRLVTDDRVRAIVVDAFASGYGFGIAAAPVAGMAERLVLREVECVS